MRLCELANNRANVPTPIGTLLCDISVAPLLYLALPGAPFAVAVPDDCALLGLQLSTQGVSRNGSTLALTNALDITLGGF